MVRLSLLAPALGLLSLATAFPLENREANAAKVKIMPFGASIVEIVSLFAISLPISVLSRFKEERRKRKRRPGKSVQTPA